MKVNFPPKKAKPAADAAPKAEAPVAGPKVEVPVAAPKANAPVAAPKAEASEVRRRHKIMNLRTFRIGGSSPRREQDYGRDGY